MHAADCAQCTVRGQDLRLELGRNHSHSGSKEKRLGNGSSRHGNMATTHATASPTNVPSESILDQDSALAINGSCNTSGRPIGPKLQQVVAKKNCARLYVGVRGSQVGLCGRDLTLSLTTIPGTSA